MLSVIMLSVIMLSVIRVNVIRLSVIMLSVIMLNVVAPHNTGGLYYKLHIETVSNSNDLDSIIFLN